ncbi:MAG: ATP-binding protein [Leptospirales bacterium]|jgi:two-component system phosphate regulon sensor histidine kinase PhoR
MRSIFFRIFFIHLLVVAIFTGGLLLFFNLMHIIEDSPRSFALLLLGALALALVLSLSASRTLTGALDGLLRRIQQFPRLGPTLVKRTQILELDRLAAALDTLINRLHTDLAGLKLEKELLGSLLGALREGVLCLNKEGSIVYQNPALHPELVTPLSTGRLYFKAVLDSGLLEFIHNRLQSTERSPEDRQYFELHHGPYFFRVQEYPVRTDEEIELHLILVQDRTQEYTTRRTREDFLQNASHELKTPITSIRGYAETLMAKLEREAPPPSSDGRLEAKDPARSFLKGMLRNVERMEAMIEDMVRISSLESRSFPFKPRRIQLQRYMQGIETLVEGTLKQKNQQLSISISEPKLSIEADPLLLEHLLLNLITNASRYSPADSDIFVKIARENQHNISFCVLDSGPGIPVELRGKVFERFFRVDMDRSREQGGTGLGLSIVRQITRLHGGSVKIETNPRGGSIFKVTLPV